jgi:hypothetical protein
MPVDGRKKQATMEQKINNDRRKKKSKPTDGREEASSDGVDKKNNTQ